MHCHAIVFCGRSMA